MANKDQYFSKTLEKGLTILNLFDREHPSRSLIEISKLTGINKTSTYRLVNTFVHLGYLRKSSDNKSLRLGTRAFALGHECFHGFDIYQGIKPVIDKTFLEHKISIDSALVDGNRLISLYRREMPNLVHYHLPLVMDELYARAMGKAILAHFTESELSGYLESVHMEELTPNTLTDVEKIRKEIIETRNRGYSVNNEEYMLGIISVGAPIMNFQKRTVAGSVSLDFPSKEYSLGYIEQNFIGILLGLAGEISEIITSMGM
ncbi:MAG: IclR family transcriptional regulator [Desulfobacteraceae bacterium]